MPNFRNLGFPHIHRHVQGGVAPNRNIIGGNNTNIFNIVRNNFFAAPLAFMRPLFNPVMQFMPPFMQNWFGAGGMPQGDCGPRGSVDAMLARSMGIYMPPGATPMLPPGHPMAGGEGIVPPVIAPRITIPNMTHDALAGFARAGNLLAGGVVNRALLPIINAGNWAQANTNVNDRFNLADGDGLPAWVTALTAPQQRQVCQFIAAYIQEVANQSPAGGDRAANVARLTAIAGRWTALCPPA